MKDSFRNLMLNVQRLTRSGRVGDATAAIQRALGIGASGRPAPAAERGTAAPSGLWQMSPDMRFPDPRRTASTGAEATRDVIDVEARLVPEAGTAATAPDVGTAQSAQPPAAHTGTGEPAADAPAAMRADAGGAAEAEADLATPTSRTAPVDDRHADPAPPRQPSAEARQGRAHSPSRFISGSFGNEAGSRPYKLFVPSGAHSEALPLVVMLHGCKQNPDDFAAGTRMNELAEAKGWLVLYPGQQSAANQLGCWNWFKAEDQQRGRGEPAIIAGMTRQVVATENADPRRVYVAGLSAGGAMADIMAATYPDVFAAAGIHSGLPHEAANDLISALHAMRHGPRARSAPSGASRTLVPLIVFHGDQDSTVHPANGEQVLARAGAPASAAAGARAGTRQVDVEQGRIAGGHGFTRTVHRDAGGRVDAEHWLVHGSGHAWSGGDASGSYTDPLGPDASAQMLRFFSEHPRG